MKKSFTFFLMILALAGNSIVPAHAEEKKFSCTGGTYSVNTSSGELSDARGCTGSLIIDNSVRSIGPSAFSSSEITSIVIPNTVTSIARSSFAFTEKLKSIVIPESVTSIGSQAFYGTGLTAIEIPGPVLVIEDLTFFNSSLASIILPKGLTKIEMSAFASNPNLTRIDIPDSVVDIGHHILDKEIKSIIYCGSAYYSFPVAPTCPSERKAIIDAALVAKAAAEKAAKEAAAEKAFAELKTFPCGSGGTYSVDRNLRFGGGMVVEGHRNCSGSVVIDQSVIRIGSSAFVGSLITDIFIPDTVKYIDSWAFKDTSQLKKVRFPDYLDEIPNWIFEGSGIEEIEIPKYTRDVAFYAFKGSIIKKFDYCGSETIYDGQYKEVTPFCQEKIDAAAAELEAEYQRQQEADKITITCKKGSLTKKVFGLSPKCPKGYVKFVPIPRCTKSEISTFNDVDMAMSSLKWGFYDAGDVFPLISKAKKATKNKTLLALYVKLESAIEAGGKGRSGKSMEAWKTLESKIEYNRC
jgi:hypothetical protein